MSADPLAPLARLLRNAERRALIVLVTGGPCPMLVWCDVDRPSDSREGYAMIPKEAPVPYDDPLANARRFTADPGLGVLVGLPPNALLTAWSPRWGFRQATDGDSRPAEAADDNDLGDGA